MKKDNTYLYWNYVCEVVDEYIIKNDYKVDKDEFLNVLSGAIYDSIKEEDFSISDECHEYIENSLDNYKFDKNLLKKVAIENFVNETLDREIENDKRIL